MDVKKERKINGAVTKFRYHCAKCNKSIDCWFLRRFCFSNHLIKNENEKLPTLFFRRVWITRIIQVATASANTAHRTTTIWEEKNFYKYIVPLNFSWIICLFHPYQSIAIGARKLWASCSLSYSNYLVNAINKIKLTSTYLYIRQSGFSMCLRVFVFFSLKIREKQNSHFYFTLNYHKINTKFSQFCKWQRKMLDQKKNKN